MTDHEKAKAWRKKHGLTVEQLSERAGYSRESIYLFEKGFTYVGRTRGNTIKKRDIDEQAWRRYRMACAGVHAELRNPRKFNW